MTGRSGSALKKKNKAERSGQTAFNFDRVLPGFLNLGNVAEALLKLEDSPDGTLDQVTAKAQRYAELVTGSAYENNRLLADTWCAAFVVPKLKAGPLQPRIEITHDVFRNMRQNPHATPWGTREEIKGLAVSYQFFHWHLAFPDVLRPSDNPAAKPEDNQGWEGGFDLILGNPPWERVKLQEKEWFAERSPEIANAPNAAARKRMIDALKAGEPALYQRFLEDSRKAEGESHLMRNSGLYPLCGRGDINVYAVFAECMHNLLNERGRAGCVLPTGIATDDTTKFFFQNVVETKFSDQPVRLREQGDFLSRRSQQLQVLPSHHRFTARCVRGAACRLNRRVRLLCSRRGGAARPRAPVHALRRGHRLAQS